MGDAADDLWDAGFYAQMDFDLMVDAIKDNCERPTKACRIVSADYEDDDDWLPYRCAVCGQKFDYP